MCIIVLSCFVLMRFPQRCSNEQVDGDGQRHLKRWQRWQQEEEKDKGKEKHRSKEEQKGPGQKGRKQGQKGQETISFRTGPVPGISKRTAKKCCCVLIFPLLSWVLTEPKNKRITTNPSAWYVLNWPICSDLLSSLDFAWAFPGANVAPHGFPYGTTSMDTSQREFQHSSQHSSLHMTLTWQIKRLNSEVININIYTYIHTYINIL